MFVLELSRDPESPNLLEILERFGQVNDRASEDEEGFYLLSCFAATMNGQVTITPEQKENFKIRLDAYIERFPKSRVLRSLRLDENKAPAELLRDLEEITGMTEEKLKW